MVWMLLFGLVGKVQIKVGCKKPETPGGSIPSPATIKNKEMEKQILVSKEIREKLTSKDGYGFNHVTVRKALRGDVSTLKRQQIRETALKEGGVYKN